MLMVSELLRVARDPAEPAAAFARSPARYGQEAGRAPPVVVWNVVGHCNLACPHCYASASREPSPGDLDHEAGCRLLEELARLGTKIVIFSGGEPLLRPDLFELLAHARAVGLSAQLSTNGVLIDAEVAARLKAVGVGYVGVSIDGLRAFNDGYRGLQGGFERAAAGLRHAHAAGLRTGLRLTLSRLNADQLDPMIDVGAELSVNRFYVSHLLYAGRAFRMGAEDLSPTESRALLWRLFERAERMLDAGVGPDLVTGGNDSDGPLLLGFVRRRYSADAAARIEELLRRRRGNSAGEKLLAIDHLGRAHPDQFWQAATLGNVKDQPLEKILAHPLRALLRERTVHLWGRCGGCRFLELCRGSHRERALARFHDIWASDPACVMTDAEIGTAVAPQVESTCSAAR